MDKPSLKFCQKCCVTRPLSEFHRNRTARDGLAGHCKVCMKVAIASWVARNADRKATTNRRWAIANVERKRASAKKWQKLNPDKNAAKNRRWKTRHPNKATEAKRAWESRNPEKHAAARHEQYRAYYERNAQGYKARAAARRALEIAVVPAWSNPFFVDEIYDLAKRRRIATGIPWHVDHVVPLKSARVCGLHWEANLAVIPGKENLKKGNRHWPDMP